MISKHLGDILGPDSVTRSIRGFSNIQGSAGEMGHHSLESFSNGETNYPSGHHFYVLIKS